MKLGDLLKTKSNNLNMAIEYKNEKISFSEWHVKSLGLCNRLLKEINNIGNVAIYLPNSIKYAISFFSILYSESIVVPIYYGSSDYEIINTLRSCECDYIITETNELEKIIAALKNYEYSVSILNIDTSEIINSRTEAEKIQKSNFTNNKNNKDVALMLHTSGSLDSPKRVMLSHENLICNIQANIQSLSLTNKDISLIALPMVFGYCNTAQFLTHVFLGAKIVISDSFFLPKKFFELVENKKITNFTGVPTMLIMITEYRHIYKYNYSSLRYICFGGGVSSKEQILSFMEALPGVEFIHTYGQTECGPRVSALLSPDTKKKLGSVGKAIPGVEIDIVETIDKYVNQNIACVGEIVVKSPSVMVGYYNNEEATINVKRNGWLYTGDLGYIDDEGFLFIVGRKKNVIISGGLNIYPEEIEGVIREIEGVELVRVRGIEDKYLGEVPIADIVVRNKLMDEKEVFLYCKSKLSQYKLPNKINFVDELALTYNGKIKRGDDRNER
ncbi:MAG TPA: class I adenylate-forming enzyme family protein [Sedimentibacter sp.]|nr:class I adenylate-forming enzyme family protein [Sedimentibacter sp.]